MTNNNTWFALKLRYLPTVSFAMPNPYDKNIVIGISTTTSTSTTEKELLKILNQYTPHDEKKIRELWVGGETDTAEKKRIFTDVTQLARFLLTKVSLKFGDTMSTPDLWGMGNIIYIRLGKGESVINLDYDGIETD